MTKKLQLKKVFELLKITMLSFLVFSGLSANAQFTNSTVPPLNGGNGSGGSTFNLTVTQPILLTEVGQAFYSGSMTYTIWMSNTAISGPPTISAANGWTMIQTGSVTGLSSGLTPTVVSVPLTTPMMLAPGTYGFYVGGSANVVYTTYNSSNQTVFTDAFTSISNGPGVGYGGNLPNPTFSTRQFNGSVTYLPAASTPNNIAISSFITPGTYCSGGFDSISLSVSNYGTNQVDSFMVVWDVNSMMDSAWFYTQLDTFGGTNPTQTTITLDTLTMPAGTANISAWTKWPNGVQDTDMSNDSTSGTYMPALSGTYLIDPAGAGDFVSFTDAVNALTNFGVCGPTIIEAVDSTYIEQIELSAFVGMSSTNTVMFRSQSGNADNVILSFASTSSANNYVVNFDGASYFSFENMTLQNLGTSYQRVITTPTAGGNTYISFDGCVITATTTNSTSTLRTLSYIYGGGNDNWTITNNTFHGGSYAMYFYGNFSNKAKNNVVENNEFVNQYFRAAYYYYQEDGVFSNNHVISNSTYTSGYALYLGQCVRVEVDANHVEGNLVWPRYGLYLVTMTGDLNTFMPVTNNRVVMPRPSGSYGMYASNCLFVELAHNSVYMNSTSNFSPALYFTGGSFNKVKNNILINGGSGSAMYVSGSGVYEMDYNNFSAPNGVVGYNGSAQTTLADWQLATGFDSNSLNVNNVMSDTATFKVCNDSLYAVGLNLPAYAMDFEGDMRQNPPCIGADEFLPISEFGFTDNPVLCNGDTLVLTQGYYDTVVWNTTDTTNTYAIYAPGTQTVSVYDACGSDTSVFNVDAQVMASIGDTNLCEGTTADLGTGISGGMYVWSDGSTDSTLNVAAAGTVSVQVIDAYGCESADTAVVTASFDVVLPDSSTFCEGSSVVLDANMTGTYAWSDGSSNQTLAVSASGTYSVTVTDQNCISTATSNVTEILDAVPSFTDSSSYLTVAFTNTSMYATSYLWDFGDGTQSTDENPVHVYPWTAVDSMNFTVTLTATNSCGDVDVVNDGVRAGQLVSVSELELAHMVSVYPNPNNGLFTVAVKTDDTQEMSVEVMDVRGSLVFAQTYGQVTGEVNREVEMSNAAQGIYFVKVTLGGETVVYRVSVQ